MTIAAAIAALTVGWVDNGCSMKGFKAATAGDPGVAPMTNLSAYPGAVCLDGTPGAYYHLPGTGSGANKWYIHHQGGGWCESMDDCLGRSHSQLGSSKDYPAAASLGGGYFSTDPTQNPLMYNWNHVFMRYCDGASFSGNAAPSEYKGETLHWAGMHIREAVVTDLLKNGLNKATDVIVSGCSAGGLATYLHTDQWCDAVPSAKCAGLPDSGFFLDYQNAPCTPTSTTSGRNRRNTIPGDYHCGLKWTYTQQNCSAGVNQDCIAAHTPTGDEWMCMFAEHSAEHIKHPVFAMQSEYDSWQTGHVLAGGQPVQQMGDNITSRLQKTLMANNPESGAFLDSCHHHCGAWNSIRIDGDLVSIAIQKWYNGLGTPNNKKLWDQGKPYPCDACCKP